MAYIFEIGYVQLLMFIGIIKREIFSQFSDFYIKI